jgi:hypothetical protein
MKFFSLGGVVFRLFSLVLVLSFVLLACSSQQRVQDVSGGWEGEAVAESVALPVRVNFIQDGTLSVRMLVADHPQ